MEKAINKQKMNKIKIKQKKYHASEYWGKVVPWVDWCELMTNCSDDVDFSFFQIPQGNPSLVAIAALYINNKRIK